MAHGDVLGVQYENYYFFSPNLLYQRTEPNTLKKIDGFVIKGPGSSTKHCSAPRKHTRHFSSRGAPLTQPGSTLVPPALRAAAELAGGQVMYKVLPQAQGDLAGGDQVP